MSELPQVKDTIRASITNCTIQQIPSFLNFEKEPKGEIYRVDCLRQTLTCPKSKHTVVTLLSTKMRWIWDLCVEKGAPAVVKVEYFARILISSSLIDALAQVTSRPLYIFSLATALNPIFNLIQATRIYLYCFWLEGNPLLALSFHFLFAESVSTFFGYIFEASICLRSEYLL